MSPIPPLSLADTPLPDPPGSPPLGPPPAGVLTVSFGESERSVVGVLVAAGVGVAVGAVVSDPD